MNSKDKIDTYIVIFPSAERALFWMKQFAEVFYEDLITLDKHRRLIQFEEATYYFISIREVSFILLNNSSTILTEDDVTVILNDEEFKRKSLLDNNTTEGT